MTPSLGRSRVAFAHMVSLVAKGSVVLSVLASVLSTLAAERIASDALTNKTDHWAFRFGPKPALPAVKDGQWLRWARNEVDRFVLAKLEEQKLTPSPEADRRTLIRRLSFDLTGLPPTPEEVKQFIGDRRADAYEHLVDRLLSSARYGERWGRHWLDAVHYGESHGYDKDKPRTNAWPYRDYVIKSFNEDKPYSRFVQEQLAGDVLFPNDPQGTIATGFIAAGPWDFVGHVELPITKTDGLIARYNDRDDMVMTTMSTFLSLTVHCARCHDHKFDPISQRDYYRLQAVFAGADRANRPYDLDGATFIRRNALRKEKRHLEARKKELDEIVAKVTNSEIQAVVARLKDAKEELKKLPGAKESPSNGYHSALEPKPDVEKWVQIDLVQPLRTDEIWLIPARPTDFLDTPGFGFPKRFRVELSDDETFKTRRILADHTADDFVNPGDKPVVISAKGAPARFVRVTATRLWERTSDYVFALAEVQILSGTNNIAKHAVVSALDSIEAGRWGKSKLTDGYDSRKALGADVEKPELAAQRKELTERIQSLEHEREKLVSALLPSETKSALDEVRRRLAELGVELDALPKPGMVYAAASDFEPQGSFTPADTPRSVHLLKRGDVTSPGEEVSPGAMDCLPGLKGHFDNDPDEMNEGARRAALAQWITHEKNLLMRRSIVNRVWQYHFGRGIVDSPNDFGHMGSLPTHPELLDWLAYWFQENGESFKKLHRLMVTSATYRQTSAVEPLKRSIVESERATNRQRFNNSTIQRFNGSTTPRFNAGATNASKESAHALTSVATARNTDSDNRFLWRMNRQRLDAESFRDALLQISGRLDLTMGGPSIQQFHFKDDHSPVYDYTRFDVESTNAFRRSVYRFIVRSVPDPFMECMDAADPSLLTPKRNTTLTALQALSALNDPFVVKQIEHFAARVERMTSDLPKQIESAYDLALNRKPTREESKILADYARGHGLVNACRALVNSSEFWFID